LAHLLFELANVALRLFDIHIVCDYGKGLFGQVAPVLAQPVLEHLKLAEGVALAHVDD